MDDKRHVEILQALAQWCRDNAVVAEHTADVMHAHEGEGEHALTAAFFADGQSNAYSSCALILERTARETK